MGREIQNIQMLPRPTQIPMFIPLQWEKSKQFWPSKSGSIFVPIERDKDLTTQLAEINYQLRLAFSTIMLFFHFSLFSKIKMVSILFVLSIVASLSYYIFEPLPIGKWPQEVLLVTLMCIFCFEVSYVIFLLVICSCRKTSDYLF